MAPPAKKILLDIGLSAMGGVLAFPLAHGFIYMLGSFYSIPSGIATVIFVTTYTGLVVVFVYRIWDDIRALTSDVRIFIIYNQNNYISPETVLPPSYPMLYDEETYELFQRLLCGFPPEYTVIKLNRLFFLDSLSSLPDPKLQELVDNQKAFSQLLAHLKKDDCIRTDGYFFTIQLASWDAKRKEITKDNSELKKWMEVANQLIEQNKSGSEIPGSPGAE
ncbi:MAG TPA: hypothetical protein VM123_14655 [archaeon]|nr:hypothetical protein [archaeon]